VLRKLAVCKLADIDAPCVLAPEITYARCTQTVDHRVRVDFAVASEKIKKTIKEACSRANFPVSDAPDFEAKMPTASGVRQPVYLGTFGPEEWTNERLQDWVSTRLPNSQLKVRFLSCELGVRYKHAELKTTQIEDGHALLAMEWPCFAPRPYVQMKKPTSNAARAAGRCALTLPANACSQCKKDSVLAAKSLTLSKIVP
jgi:hypothetical protein